VNGKEYVQLFQDDDLLNHLDAETLKSYLKQYPYSRGLTWLIARKAHLNHDKNLDKDMELAAIYAYDHKALNSFVNRPIVSKSHTSKPNGVPKKANPQKEKGVAKKIEKKKAVKKTAPKQKAKPLVKVKKSKPSKAVAARKTQPKTKEPKSFSGWLTHFSGDQAHDESNQESEAISETLAELLVKQDKVAQAVSMYERLSLKFPEKSTSFAARILELKKSIQ